jgi:hypothetical protein
VIVFILIRFGFLALVAWAICENAASAQLHTWDPAAWYAGRSWFLLAILAALAIYAFRIAVAGSPIFRTPLAGEAGARRR